MDLPPTEDKDGVKRHKLSELSETELVDWVFSVSDPESLDDVSDDPPPAEDPEVEFFYDMAGRGLKVRCVYCCYPNHYAGIVVRYPSGARRLVGRDCARTHHGVDFERQLIEFDAAVERQSYARRKQALIAAGSHIAAAFAELRVHPAIGNHDDVLSALRGRMPDLAAALAEVGRRGDRLVIDRVVRDTEGERARRARLGDRFEEVRQEVKDAGGDWRMFRHEPDDIGPLSGALFFANGVRIEQRLADIETTVQATIRAFATNDDLRAAQIRAGFGRLAEQRDALELEFARLEALRLAFEADNLVRIARWANDAAAEQARREAERENRKVPPQKLRFRAVGRSIAERRFGGAEVTVALPQTYHLPGRSIIALLKRAATVEHEP